MYEQLKNDMLVELYKKGYNNEQIREIISCLDVAAYSYDVTKKELQIIPYRQALLELKGLYLACRKVEGFADGTLRNHSWTLDNFLTFVQKPIEDVTATDVRVYLYKYQEERNVTNRTLDKVRSAISSFFKWCLDEGYIEKDPTHGIGQIKWSAEEKKACTQVDLEYLRLACKTPKHKALLELFYSSGCRISEIANIKVSDINFKEGEMLVFGKGKKYRIVYLNAKAEVALEEYLKSRVDDNDALFVSDRRPYKPMKPAGIRKIIRKMEGKAQEKLSVHVTPHTLRRTMATTMLANKADITSIQKILGHSNINTTLLYAQRAMADVKADHRKAVI